MLYLGLKFVKHRSSVLDNDIGSVGPVRRIRQKSNLLYSIGSCSPISGSSSSVARGGMVKDAAQQPLSSMQKPAKENVDDIIPSSSFPSLPSKSSEVASKILHQLDKLVSPKEKSSELRLPIEDGKYGGWQLQSQFGSLEMTWFFIIKPLLSLSWWIMQFSSLGLG